MRTLAVKFLVILENLLEGSSCFCSMEYGPLY